MSAPHAGQAQIVNLMAEVLSQQEGCLLIVEAVTLGLLDRLCSDSAIAEAVSRRLEGAYALSLAGNLNQIKQEELEALRSRMLHAIDQAAGRAATNTNPTPE